MTFEQEKKKPKPLLPIRFTGLYGKRPPLEEVPQTPEPSKVEAPVTPTPTPEGIRRIYGSRATTPEMQTVGTEKAKEHLRQG